MSEAMGASSSSMALPPIKTLSEAADYSTTVLPYVDQLYDLPRRLVAAGFNSDALQQVYLETNPLMTAFAFSLFLAPIFLVVSEINKNYSQVDRMWSILPTIYNAHYWAYAHYAGIPTTYIDLILAFSVIWTTRLTYNYWRKGGYQVGSEDYRWEIVKSYVPAPVFFLFNVAFISLAQSVLLFLITTPVYLMLLATQKTGNKLDLIDTQFAAALPVLIAVEWLADQQQWDYYNARSKYRETAKVPSGYTRQELDRGFNTRGLWAWSRHPNFACEQTIWMTLYAWSCYRTGTYVNWTGLGAFSYVWLFQASTWLTELISSGKYPEYGEYQLRVGKFYPSLTTLLTGPTILDDPTATDAKRKAIEAANKKKT